MSVIAMNWVDSIKVGNSTAKALLRFLASHNFHKPGFFFKNSTYMNALEISERTLQRAFDHLEKGNWIKVERRFDEDGRQIANGIYLNIPDNFLDSYESIVGEGVISESNDNPVKMTPLGTTNCRGGSRQNDAPYNNNISNNNINNKRERKKRAPLSPFLPNNENILLCQQYGLNLEDEVESFKERHKGEKTQYEFKRWLDNGLAYKNKKSSSYQKTEIKRPVFQETKKEKEVVTDEQWVKNQEAIKKITAMLSGRKRINSCITGDNFNGKKV